jgi:isopentenyl-diphosphate delta-isomerase
MTNNIRQKSDKVVLVNQQDEVIGTQDKILAHKGQGQLHRACSVFLFDDKDRLLLQQRSQHKIVAPGKWANTACGNLRPQESYRDCALRRLKQELGIEGINLQQVGKFHYRAEFDNGFVENEIDTVFAGRFEGEVWPEPTEVRAVQLAFLSEIEAKQPQYAPWLDIILSHSQISQKLNQFIKQTSYEI